MGIIIMLCSLCFLMRTSQVHNMHIEWNGDIKVSLIGYNVQARINALTASAKHTQAQY